MTADAPMQEEERQRKHAFVRYGGALLRDPVTLVATIILATLFICALGADWIAPYDPLRQQLAMRNQPPLTPAYTEGGFPHILGTDELGRDLFTRLIYGGQVSIAVGLIGAIIACVVGTGLGLLAGYYRGRVDNIVMRTVDAMAALPTLLIALFFLFVVGGGFWNLVIVLAVVRWRIFARVSRSMALSMREEAFVQAARAIGGTDSRIIFRHLLPNMMSPLLVLFTLEVAVLILAEAALSFLGFGIQPPDSSWGLMIARGREYLRSAWWLVTIPGLAIFATTLGLNLLAAWARAVTDPVQRWRWLS
jgi:peptide/nickel transport system permease protein